MKMTTHVATVGLGGGGRASANSNAFCRFILCMRILLCQAVVKQFYGHDPRLIRKCLLAAESFPPNQEETWRAMFSTDEWKDLVEAMQSATESGNLRWTLDGDLLDLENKPTALRFLAKFDGNARINLFGRFRGFSYSAEIYREGSDGYEFQDSITVKSKANSHDIPFNALFRSALAQVRESRKRTMETNRDRWIMWALNCLELLPGHDHEVWDWASDFPEDWVAELTENQWDVLVRRVIAGTESRQITWTQDERTNAASDYRSFRANVNHDFSLTIAVGGQSEAFDFYISDPEGIGAREDFGVLSEYSGGQLERLAELIGASSRRQFQEIVKNQALQGFLKGLGRK